MQKVLTQEQTISALNALGHYIAGNLKSTLVQEAIYKAYVANNWFTPDFTKYALQNICALYLDEYKLKEFATAYRETEAPKKVAIVMAGNIPLSGFHDWLCVMLSGHTALVKCSSKDAVLLPFLIETLKSISPNLAARTIFSEKLSAFDAVIATGSNNSNRYFDYYFGKYPHIFRNNRSSMAILSGKESHEELNALSDDIFIYFGLGCRSVSKLFVPEGYDIASLLPHFNDYSWLTQHTKYMNNSDYNRTILLLNNTPHFANEFISLTESKSIHSSIAVLHYEYYNNLEQLHGRLMDDSSQTQTIVGIEHQAFGTAQQPTLQSFADNTDTMAFLCSL
jgi:hypothetical protein